MEASPSGKISSKLVVHFLRNTGSIKNEREASPQRNNHIETKIDWYNLNSLVAIMLRG